MYLQHENEFKIVAKDSSNHELGVTVMDYTLIPGDILKISVFSLSHDEYNFMDKNEERFRMAEPRLNGFMINDSGFVILPIVGSIELVGKTVFEAERVITENLKDYLPSPNVVVKHLNFSYTILGEAANPGNYLNYERRLNIFEAISKAGDLTDFADRTHVRLIRNINGVTQVYYMNLLDENVVNSPGFQVLPRDMIFISPLRSKNAKKYVLTNIAAVVSTLAALTIILWRFKS